MKCTIRTESCSSIVLNVGGCLILDITPSISSGRTLPVDTGLELQL